MIRITKVQGSVLVDDRRNGSTQMAQVGLVLDGGGDYVLALVATFGMIAATLVGMLI